MLRTNRTRRITAFLLAAGMPLMTLSSTASFRHAHEEGEVAHQHAGGALHRLTSDGFENARLHAHRCDPVVVAGGHEHHWHVWFFGVFVHLPAPLPDQPASTPANLPRAILALCEQSTIVVPDLRADEQAPISPSLSILIRRDIFAGEPRSGPQGPRKLPFPLCDRARHERSGVQLA